MAVAISPSPDCFASVAPLAIGLEQKSHFFVVKIKAVLRLLKATFSHDTDQLPSAQVQRFLQQQKMVHMLGFETSDKPVDYK